MDRKYNKMLLTAVSWSIKSLNAGFPNLDSLLSTGGVASASSWTDDKIERAAATAWKRSVQLSERREETKEQKQSYIRLRTSVCELDSLYGGVELVDE